MTKVHTVIIQILVRLSFYSKFFDGTMFQATFTIEQSLGFFSNSQFSIKKYIHLFQELQWCAYQNQQTLFYEVNGLNLA